MTGILKIMINNVDIASQACKSTVTLNEKKSEKKILYNVFIYRKKLIRKMYCYARSKFVNDNRLYNKCLFL